MNTTIRKELTPEQILAGNKVIAGFCDGKHPIEDNVNILKFPFTVYHMEYHKNYQWLMPAWFKFRDLKFEAAGLKLRHSNYCHQITQAICYSNIETAFRSLSIAIEWYNKLEKK